MTHRHSLAATFHTLPSELVDRPAPPFTLPRFGVGGTVELTSLRGEVVVVNFWASWCLACRKEHPKLLAAWERYRERGVVLVGVDFEDTKDAPLAYTKEMGGDWPLVTDPGSRTAIADGVFGVPETFVIASNGVITAKRVGAVSPRPPSAGPGERSGSRWRVKASSRR